MYFNFKPLIGFLLIALFFIPGCKKSVFDYRHKYIGKWEITIVRTFWYSIKEEVDTSTYQAEIAYGSENDEIYVNNTPYQCLQFSVTKKGLLCCPNQSNPIGEISKKDIKFTFEYRSPGSRTILIASGRKK